MLNSGTYLNSKTTLPYFMRAMDKLIQTNLRRLREQRGFSQQALADIVGVDRCKISAWENGHTGIGKQWMAKLCETLQAKPYEFYLDKDAPLPASDFERRALMLIKEAGSLHIENIAEEWVEYLAHRVDTVKKQAEQGAATRRPPRHKAGSG